MKNLNIQKLEELSNTELTSIKGGGLSGWSPTFWWGYLAAEVLEGIQRGIKADCSEACTR
jgi:bacteriocin-like protein